MRPRPEICNPGQSLLVLLRGAPRFLDSGRQGKRNRSNSRTGRSKWGWRMSNPYQSSAVLLNHKLDSSCRGAGRKYRSEYHWRFTDTNLCFQARRPPHHKYLGPPNRLMPLKRTERDVRGPSWSEPTALRYRTRRCIEPDQGLRTYLASHAWLGYTIISKAPDRLRGFRLHSVERKAGPSVNSETDQSALPHE